MITKIFYDLETTGVKVNKHCIHQLAGLVEVDGVVTEQFDFKLRPHPKALIEEAALKASGVTLEDINNYPDYMDAFKGFTSILGKYINQYDTKDKAYLVGYNNRAFDDPFLRKFFELCGNKYFGSWFWPNSLDVMVLASQYLLDRRPAMPSFKLHRVGTEVGLVVDKERLHDAAYDINLTRDIYRVVTGLEIEL